MNVTYAEVTSWLKGLDSANKKNLLMLLSYDSESPECVGSQEKPMSQRDVFKTVDKEKYLFLINVK